MSSEQHIADRIRSLVYRLGPPAIPVFVLGPVAVLDELGAWVADDHQCVEGRAKNWIWLLDDVLSGWNALPSTLKAFAARSDATALAALKQVRKRLSAEAGNAIDPASRRALSVAEHDLRTVLAQPEALTASWADLVRAVKRTDFERERSALALLAGLCELQGKPWRPVSHRLWLVLGDDQDEIDAIRAEIAGQQRPAAVLPPRRANESASARLALAEQALSLPAESGDLVVWLAFVRAHVPGERVAVGPSVTLFDGRWLHSVLEHWEHAARAPGDVPTEVAVHREVCLEAWETELPDSPFALIRIAIGPGPVASAIDEARTTAGALLQLAAFYDRGKSCWRGSETYIVFVNGEPRWRDKGIAADDERGAALDLARDQTAVTLKGLAPTVGPQLPVTDPQVRAALDLLRWLTETRGTWSPAALLLNDRVLENVAGWSGFGDARRFAVQQLGLAWAFSQAQQEVVDAGIEAVNAIDRSGGLTPADPVRRAAFLEATVARAIVTREGIVGDHANPAEVITHIAWLDGWQQPGTDAHVRLAALQARTASGPAAARWLGQLQSQFEVLLDRVTRTRNAIAHGGPIAESTLQTVSRFYDEIASDALNQALYVRLTGQLPRAWFEQRRQRLEQRLDDLAHCLITPAQGLVVD